MDFNLITELHYITPISTVPSILDHGILSHQKAERLPHTDISMDEIQKRRSRKKIPGGRPLHHYANLYFDAHNPMLSKRREKNREICILRISSQVLLLPDVVLTDRNASSDYVRFFASPNGLNYLDDSKIYAQYWTSNDQLVYWELKSKKCAEVLIPEKVSPKYILSAYVYDEIAMTSLMQCSFNRPVENRPDIFF